MISVYEINRSVLETINKHPYKKISNYIIKNYPLSLNIPIGKFLLQLKNDSDKTYKKFLNKYGDEVYSKFYIDKIKNINKKGIYIFLLDKKIQYIGRCRNSIVKRINNGYGRIYPKGCYKDGRTTDCHINSLISVFSNLIK